jgi:hypothetical protein
MKIWIRSNHSAAIAPWGRRRGTRCDASVIDEYALVNLILPRLNRLQERMRKSSFLTLAALASLGTVPATAESSRSREPVLSLDFIPHII